MNSDTHPEQRLNERAQRTKQLIEKPRNLGRVKTLHDMLHNQKPFPKKFVFEGVLKSINKI